MGNILYEVHCFASEILALIDEGKSITLEEFEDQMDKKRIIEFIKEKFGFRNINSTTENQQLLKERFNDMYVSENEANKKCINNNGLVYLLECLFDILEREAYDYIELVRFHKQEMV